MKTGTNIRKEREKRNLSLADLSILLKNKTGESVSTATLQRYESGHIKTIPYGTVTAIAEIFGMNPAALVGWIIPDGAKAKVYELIRQRRLELNMTQEELAKRLGYKSRSAIARIESGDNDIPRLKILTFAKALDVDPSYFLGSTSAGGIPQSMIDAYSKLNSAAQKRAAEYMEDLLYNPHNLR